MLLYQYSGNENKSNLSLPGVVDYMRTRDQTKPEERSWPSPGMVAKTATIPGRPSRKIGKNRRSNGTFTPDAISDALQLD